MIIEEKVSEIFSKYTGLRHCSISDNSGEEFYHNVLNELFYKTIIENNKLKIILDGKGYSPSFIDEAFGNLVYDFTLNKVLNNLIIVSDNLPIWRDSIEKKTFPSWEERRKNNEKPKKTKKHKEWWSFVNGDYIKNS